MTSRPFAAKPLEKEDRTSFTCGRDSLDHYFRTRIGQDVRRRIATAFIVLHKPTATVAGFYTLSAAQVPFTDLDEDWRRSLPRYPTLPAVLVGRLAVDRRFQGQGLGGALLTDAASRAIRSDIGAHFLIVDALDEDAARFYQHHGMRHIADTDNRFFIPLSVLAKAPSGH